MIPKIIHLCWLSGDPYPAKIAKCLDTWKKHLPDYEVMLWDTNRFDLNSSIWVRQAFEKKKYAFAADYIRFYALYHYGGIYLDSDVEVLKSFDDLLDLPYFMGAEKAHTPEAAIIGAEKVCLLIEDHELRKTMGQAGVLSAQRYDASRVMPMWKELFEHLALQV